MLRLAALVSPILIRPIREQFEHDRVIRQLQARWRRRFAVAINPGQEETASVRSVSRPVFPDLVLTSTDHGRRHHGVVEVETTESVNHLEAMAEWAHLAKVRGAFYLYVPAGAADVARRLCEDNRIAFTEIWTYYPVGPQVRFSMVHRSAAAVRAAKARKTIAAATAAKPATTRKSTKPRTSSVKVSSASKATHAKKSAKASATKRTKASKATKTATSARTTRTRAKPTRSVTRKTAKTARKTPSTKAAASTRRATRKTAKRSSAKRR